MSRLHEKHLARLRGQLSARFGALRREMRDALHPAGGGEAGLANRRDEVDDDAVADLESGLDVAGLERDARELNAVAQALARMDAGQYGVCVACGEPIPLERLEAQPQAARCVACEARAERAHPGAAGARF